MHHWRALVKGNQRQREPETNIGKEHRPAIPRLVRMSVAMYQDDWTGLGETRRVSLAWALRWDRVRRKRLLPYLRAKLRPLEGLHRREARCHDGEARIQGNANHSRARASGTWQRDERR